jgi:hypothetical protein
MAPRRTLDQAIVRRWLAGYKSAWERADPRAAAELFTADAKYFETPFDPPMVGPPGIRAYWQAVPESQREVAFESEIVALRSSTAVVRWRARFVRLPARSRVELDGVFLLEFAGDGRCRSLREWWHRRETPFLL